ncbi:Vacuolar protein sorting-associated protein 8 [Lithohypha guttulata]|uniref:Vacuolar protein sorting-associated protein 8 n=1 Tax=Lithohypha guttulata TaxID=1690604 RepID=UPI002DDDD546|nr:Vacuolar protein sorting-associated protein 8 [Lithohypha guttulata]
MSSTPEDGEIEQHAVEAVDRERHIADLPDETLPLIEDENAQEELVKDLEEDVDTIPQLDVHEDTGNNEDDSLLDMSHDVGTSQPGIQVIDAAIRPASLDGSVSIPDDTPSIQDSGLSSPRSDGPAIPPLISRKSSTASRRPFELRFQSRLSSSYLNTPRASSPGFLNAHSRQSSLASFGPASESATEDTQTPWEVIRWTRLRRLTAQVFSEIGRRNFGNPTCLVVTEYIVIGTSKGLILVYDHQQNNKATIGLGTKATESGSVTALAISADHTAIAAGYNAGNILVWEVIRPSRPFMQIPAVDATAPEARKLDGHLEGSGVLHVGFLGYRRTALVSADDKGMAFSHLASRGTGALGRTIRTTRILGRYPEVIVRKASKPVKKSSVLAFAPMPLGNIEQKTDSLGLVAMLTPYLLVVVSTTPIAQTQHKAARPKEVAAHSAMTAALAWFPAIKLKGSETNVSKNKLVYAWSNVISVLEVEEAPRDPETPQDKPVELMFVSRSRYESEEAIVALQWLSRSVVAALTITQQLLIIEDVTMTVTDAFDLLPKNLYHADLYSHQLQAVIEHHDDEDEDTSMHGVVADGYYMSFRVYKGRLFLLGSNEVWWGSLTNWADRLLALMETGDFIAAIRLATNYYSGSSEKVTIGLPEDNALRSSLVHDKLLEMMSASLRYAFGKNEQASDASLNRRQLVDLAVACVAACLRMNEKDFLFHEVFDWYDENNAGDILVDVLEPHILDRQITSLPPAAVKTLINHFVNTHTPSHLEEVICLLDATEMDVDQVTSLCKRHNLYDAYIYVWNTALMDYTSPLLELLDMTFRKPGANGSTTSPHTAPLASQKVFPYLSFILTSRVYPIGDFMDDDRALSAKTQIYELLFYGKGGEKDPFATLRRLLEFDVSNFMAALNEAFEDSFLNSGQDESLHDNGEHRSSVFNRQIIVRILLDVMSTGFDATERIYLDMFIARNLPKYPQYMLLAGTTMEQVFTRLCEYQDEDLHDDAQLSIEYLMTVYKPSNIVNLIPLLQKAHFYRILKMVYRQEEDWPKLLDMYFVDTEDQSQVFDVILECLRPSSDLDQKQRQDVVDELKRHVEDLSKIDVARTAKVIEIVLSDDHAFFLDSLADAKARYTYLSTLLEPADGAGRSQHITNNMIEEYVRLICRFQPSHVVDYISTVKEGELRLENVVPALETSGNIDAAVVLLARQGQVQDAMDRLIKHLSTIEAALSGVLESAADSPDEVATNEAIEDLLSSVDKYAKVGIWLCESQTQNAATRSRTPSKSPRRSSIKQPLSFEENLWLDFIAAVVSIAQRVGTNTIQDSNSTDSDEVVSSLRNTIQRVFTALLNSTAVARSQKHPDSLRFVRILRAFLSRAAEVSPSLSHLRHVMSSIFSAYGYEESLLSLSNAMLDKDLFVHVHEVTKLREIGWRPRGQVCGLCRRRVWGPGIGLKVWEAYERNEKERTRRLEGFRRQSVVGSEGTEEEGRGKGKATEVKAEDEDDDDEEQRNVNGAQLELEAEAIVVFSCRHLFHRRCLVDHRHQYRNQGVEGADDDASVDGQGQSDGQGANRDGRLVCPSCV